ncbi:hypothetical protein OUZ56_006383 [Daphnia magna]|uniref:Uncharacterized protein n=3 Tax=Daphnia TaxID=6668 RepID=A0ABQ9YVH1_9CRUS|nr:hypothetical protein OUZ56_006383 [Daphnia magna]
MQSSTSRYGGRCAALATSYKPAELSLSRIFIPPASSHGSINQGSVPAPVSLEGPNHQTPRRAAEVGIMEAILESNKSLWKRTGNMALVVVGALSIFLASVEEVHLDLEQFWTDLGVPSLLQRILPYVAAG